MKTYQVKVVVEYNYEVDVDSEEEAQELGWQYEDYRHFGEVYSIDTTLISDDEEEEDND